MEIKFSAHALKRVKERKLSIQEVKLTVEEPIETIHAKYGRKVSCKHFIPCRYLVVVYESLNEGLIVVTALKINRERALKYGFTRI